MNSANINLKDFHTNLANICLSFFRKLISVIPLNGNNIASNCGTCFGLSMNIEACNLGISNSDIHIYLGWYYNVADN